MGISHAAVGLLGLFSLRVCSAFVLTPAVLPQLTSWRCCNSHSSSRNKPSLWHRSTERVPSVRSSAADQGGGVDPSVKRRSPAQQESDVFNWLAGNAGIHGQTVSLRVTKGGYRGLVANYDVEQGQVRRLSAVPYECATKLHSTDSDSSSSWSIANVE